MILLQSSLPCSENFYRYKKNYEKFVNKGPKSHEGSPKSSQASGTMTDIQQKKTVASPKIMSKLSPINTMIGRTSLQTSSLLNKYAQNSSSCLYFLSNIESFEDLKLLMIIGLISTFSSSFIGTSSFCCEATVEEEFWAYLFKREEVEKMRATGIDEPGSPTRFDAIRLPNQVSSTVKTLGDTRISLKNQSIMSPTSILSGGNKKLDGFFQ